MILSIKKYFYFFFLLVLIMSCVENFETGEENANTPPNTTMANIPVENDTLFALIELYWDGEDNDGFVVKYQYRYTTFPIGGIIDSISHDWVDIEGTSSTIAFTSPEDLNRQVFRVRSVDNSGNIDPSPAVKVLYTNKTLFPSTEITGPLDGSEYFAVTTANSWFKGIEIAFNGRDRDGEIIEFAWAVNDGEWTWVDADGDDEASQTILIPPSAFGTEEDLHGDHIVKVFSKDNTYLIDSTGASIEIELVVPTWEKDILIMDDTVEDFSLREVEDDTVDAFYDRHFEEANPQYIVDNRNLETRGWPSLKIMGRYRLIIYHSENSTLPFYLKDTETGKKSRERLRNYLSVGGDIIFSGTRIVESFWTDEYFDSFGILKVPQVYPAEAGDEYDNFVNKILHIQEGHISGTIGTMEGAIGLNGFSDIEVDTSKCQMEYPWSGKPHRIQTVDVKGGFTREIFKFVGNDPFAGGKTCGLRYYGDVFDLIFLGFPMWQIKEEDAAVLARELLTSLGY